MLDSDPLAELVDALDREVLETSAWQPGAPARVATAAIAERHLAFGIADASAAAPLDQVLEVQRIPPITLIPGLPSWILGVSNLRGDILSVVDFRDFLGLAKTNLASETARMLVVTSRARDLVVGLVADRVLGIHKLLPHELRPAAGQFDPRMAAFLRGLHVEPERVLAVLDLEAVLQSAEMRQFHAV